MVGLTGAPAVHEAAFDADRMGPGAAERPFAEVWFTSTIRGGVG